MQVKTAIKERRSIRNFTNRQVKKSAILKILNSGIWAPSGLNNQPWKYKVLKDKAKDKLAQFTEYAQIIKNVPICICVFLNHERSYNRDKDIMALGASIQNMLLSAYELGISSCWLGEILKEKDVVRKTLNLSVSLELMAVVVLGYAKKYPAKGKRKKLNSFIIK